ncbi:MAG: HAD family phosphatase [Oscillospiraceae bacterium]|nr:HAD family phosphatase [Oscillospiraceae bacterium]
MKIKCCVFDLDGTLLTSKNVISETDKATLRKLSRNGVRIVIATGRTDLQILEYVHSLGVSDPVITCNGGQIINITTGEVLHRAFLRPTDVERIIDIAEKEGIDYMIYTPECVYHKLGSERVKFYMAYNETAPEEFRVPIRKITEYPPQENFSNVLKFAIQGDTSTIPELNRRLNGENTLTIVSSGKNLIDIMPENTTKGNGVKILSEKIGVPISEIAVFGDSMNDETMLRTAGFSVAMGNAEEEIKEICDFITLTNNEGGITYALKHIFEL